MHIGVSVRVDSGLVRGVVMGIYNIYGMGMQMGLHIGL